MLKRYCFQFDISGSCVISLDAKSDAEAVRMLKSDDFESELNEWSIDFPSGFRELGTKEVMQYLSHKGDIE